MKFGAHIYLWIERFSDATLDVFDRARSLGLSILEIAVGDDVQFSPALARRAAANLGLELTLSPGSAWPMHADISLDDPAHRAFGLKWHKRWIETAAELGAVSYSGAIYGHPGAIQRRIPPADELPRVADNLHILAEHARRLGTKLVLEPMSHFRTHILNTPQQAMRLMDLADHPNLMVLLDTYHLVTEIRDYADAIRTVRPKLWGLHACENDRGAPGGGLLPWDAICSALIEGGDDYYILLESYNSSLNDFAYRRGLFHNVCPDGDAFARQSLAFLQSTLTRTAGWAQPHAQPPNP